MPAGPRPLMFELFQGVNTATTRPGVPDEMAYWLDGWMPLAPRNLRTLYGIGSALYTVTPGRIIIWYSFYNIGATPYVALFLSDGSVIQANTTTGATTTILAAGSILLPNIPTTGATQWGQQYLLIVAKQPNGYWVWDGALLYEAGTLAPGILLTNAGAGYSTIPTVTISGGNGTGATAVATIANGLVTSVTLTNPGSGYQVGDTPVVTIGPGSGGTGAMLTAVISSAGGGSGASLTCVMSSGGVFGYHVVSVTINSGGTNYSNLTVINVSGGSPNTAAVLTPVITGGVITSVTIVSGGAYANSVAPTATVVDNSAGNYKVTSVTINSGGSGYSPSTSIAVTAGGSPITQAVIFPVITGGVIVGTTIENAGLYGSNTPPTLTVNDTAVTATATVSLMPFAVSGTAAETYQGHVWIMNGATVLVSAPGSITDFSTSAGGDLFTSNDSFLKVAYTQAIQSNGFLFLIGDSSMNYISGVTETTANGVTTLTFTNNNADPEIGTPYPASVITQGQEIMLANSTGIFVSSGGTFVKRSEAMDGVYGTVPNFNGQQLSAAKATIFSRLVRLMLVPIIDPVSGNQVNKLLMYNGRQWWATQQDVPLTFIAAQEINSVFTAWGTDGTHLYPLFQQPSTFTKTAQSRLWDTPGGYWNQKAATRLWALASFIAGANLSYTIAIDNENTVPGIPSTATYTGTPNAIAWTNASGNPVTCTNASSAVVMWYIAGAGTFAVLPPQGVGQDGVLTGMTVTTNCGDMVLISTALRDEITLYRG